MKAKTKKALLIWALVGAALVALCIYIGWQDSRNAGYAGYEPLQDRISSAATSAAGALALLGAAIAAIALYLLPTIIAAKRQHRQTGPIAIINLLLGFTLLGWVAALAWSVSADKKKEEK